MGESGFIVPPPGLIPERADAVGPDREAEPIAATYPSFRPATPLPSGPPSATPVPPPESAALPGPWTLHLADARSVTVIGAIVIGRDPAAVDVRPHAILLPVTDPTRSVSKTHALVDLENGELSITDLHSTNGVVVTRADGSTVEAIPGHRTTLSAGDTVVLGEFAITVSRA